MGEPLYPLPTADGQTGLKVLKALVGERSLLAALGLMQHQMGDYFQITLPRFKPVVVVGPEANRQILVTNRDAFCWRVETDPVTRLLQHGLLVEDGESHKRLRRVMEPMFHRTAVNEHVAAMSRYTDQVLKRWDSSSTQNMVHEMRRITLLILFGTLFRVNFSSEIDRLWRPILRLLAYISPGPWILWPRLARYGYRSASSQVDEYLYQLIQTRRNALAQKEHPAHTWNDLLTRLIKDAQLNNELIRDQLLTMLIAGHDTSTSLLSWSLYLLGMHPDAMSRARAEVDDVLGNRPPTHETVSALNYLDQVIKEALRLYPPIHIGNRSAMVDGQIAGYRIPARSRVMYSIYLSHRHKEYWDWPDQFMPERFADRQAKPPPFTYVPFGGGPRNCIGAIFGQVEVRVVLARLLQYFDLQLVSRNIRPSMKATLEPSPDVFMKVRRRRLQNV